MWLNQSSLLRCMDDYGEAERMLRMTFVSAKEGEDKALIKSCLGDLLMLYVEEERMIEARNVYTELLFGVDEEYGTSSYMSKLAKLYASEGNFVQANRCLEQGWICATDKTDSVCLYIASSELYNLT